jgi:peptide/nickel transport system substrate-binding protein
LNLGRGWSLSTACAVLMCAAAVGCGAPPRPQGIVVYASGTDLESGNPLVTVHSLSRQLQRYALFVTLARYDSLLEPQPYGARAWDWSADRRALTFHLVNGLVWQDGAPTTARDAAFTINAARDPATGYPRAADLSAVDAAVAVDDSTVQVRFVRAQPDFPLVFCELPLVPEHLLGAVPHADLRRAPFNLNPVGNGPFSFVSRVAGQRWVFARNEHFPAALGGPPKLRGLIVTVVDEPTTKFAGLASGDLDVAGISPTTAYLVKRDALLRVIEYPILLVNAIVFNVHRPPFDDVRVRRAVSASLDRGRIIRAALAGYGVPAAGPVAPENPLALPGDSLARQDTVLADSLLDAAGWRRGGDGARAKAGRPFSFELLTVGSGDNAVEQLIQADLAQRGIRMDIRQVEMGSFLSQARAARKSFDALLTGIPGDVSLSYLGAMFDSRQAGGALDYSGYHTRELDAAFDGARSATTMAERRADWWAVQRQLAVDEPVAWVYHSRGVQGVSARLQGLRMDLRGELVTVHDWFLAPSSPAAARPR